MSGISRARLWLMLTLLIGLVGCELPSVEKTAAKPRRARRSREQKVNAKDHDVTIEDGQRFATKLLRAVEANDAVELAHLIDWDAMVDPAAREWKVPESVRSVVVSKLKSQSANGKGLVGDLLKLTRTGEFTVVRVHSGPEGIGVWFRLVVGDSLPNYSDYQLKRNASGEVVARDVYETLTGQFVGEAMRPILADIVEHSSKGMVEKLTSVPLVSLKHKLAHMKFRKLVNSENHAAAVACYRELPEILQRDKSNLMLYVECASQLSTVEVDRAMAEARRYYSEDSLDGMFLAPHINQGNHLEAIGCVDRLSQRVGGDSRLSLLRTCLLIDAGKFEEARESALMLLDWTKSTDGYAACLCVATRTDNEAMMIELFETLQARDWTLPKFESEPYFSEFVASPRYKEWLRRQEVAERPEEPTAENEDAAEYSSWPRQL